MTSTTGLTSIAITAALAVGFSAPAEETRPSLYDRLGGMPAIQAVVNGLLNRIVKDDRVNGWFGWAGKPERAAAYKSHLATFVCQATGGPCQYPGRDMRATHHGMAITKKAFDSVVEDAGLANFDAQLEQFAVNSGSAPRRILAAHPANEITNIQRNRWTTGSSAPYLPCPE